MQEVSARDRRVAILSVSPVNGQMEHTLQVGKRGRELGGFERPRLLNSPSCCALLFLSPCRYLSFVEPLLNDDQEALKATRAAVEAFGKAGGDGSKLHAFLVDWDKQHKGTSYISQMWYEMYLQNRDALPLNLAPQITWLDHADARMNDQAIRAACLMHAAARFYLTMQREVLQPDVFHTKPEVSKSGWFQHLIASPLYPFPSKLAWLGAYLIGKAYPLDMSQYKRLFHSTRIPKRGEDKLWSASIDEGTTPRHVIIQRGPRFYKVDVLAPNPSTGQLEAASVQSIEAQLRGILADLPTSKISSPPYTGPEGPSSSFTTFDYSKVKAVEWSKGGKEMAPLYAKEAPVGALTGLPRDQWADARQALEASSAANVQSLKDVDSALFALTLEHACPETHEDLSRAMLHGDGRNRWFDKCFNIIVCGNGKSGISWEHAWGDGVAVLYFFNEVFKAINQPEYKDAFFGGSSSSGGSGAAAGAVVRDSVVPVSSQSRVSFDLSSSEQGKKALQAVREAEAFTDKIVSETDLRVYASHSMTKADVKKSGLNPDGLMQMVLQLAHWRTHQFTASSYESASTAGFKHGRTEVIRPATRESVEMCKVFSDKSKSHKDKFAALDKATSRHRKTTVDCMMGKGVDRHLFALQKWCERGEVPGVGKDKLPSLFTDPAYRTFKDIRVSTSTLASPALAGGGFGPVSRTSYGVGYGIEERGAHFHVMAYKPSTGSTTDVNNFIEGVEQALKEFVETINAAAPTNNNKEGGDNKAKKE